MTLILCYLAPHSFSIDSCPLTQWEAVRTDMMQKIITGGGKNRLVVPLTWRLLRLITLCVSLNSVLGAESSVQSLRVNSHLAFSSLSQPPVAAGSFAKFRTQVAFTKKGLGIFVLTTNCLIHWLHKL